MDNIFNRTRKMAIAGIVAGMVVAAFLIGTLCWFAYTTIYYSGVKHGMAVAEAIQNQAKDDAISALHLCDQAKAVLHRPVCRARDQLGLSRVQGPELSSFTQ